MKVSALTFTEKRCGDGESNVLRKPEMCGRYYVDDEFDRKVEALVNEISERMFAGTVTDRCPSDRAQVITLKQGKPSLGQMSWGFSGKDNKLLINARAETAHQKPTFCDSLENRRILIPASGFYEWDQLHQKYTFTLPENELMLFAGFCHREESGERFIIMTTEANESMWPVHDRMPLLIAPSEMQVWFSQGTAYRELLKKKSPTLNRKTSYEQVTFGGLF